MTKTNLQTELVVGYLDNLILDQELLTKFQIFWKLPT